MRSTADRGNGERLNVGNAMAEESIGCLGLVEGCVGGPEIASIQLTAR